MKTLKVKNKNYNKEKIIELEKAMREAKSLRMYKRYSVVSKHFQGFINRAIAEMECLDAHTVSVYIKNYKRNGLEGLVMNTSPGCPRTLSKKQEEQLVHLITTKTHHAKLLKPFLDEMKDRIQLMFLPLYSPKLNLIEGLWGWLKSSVINNVFFNNIFQVKKSVQNFINNINKVSTENINRLCVKM